MDKLCANCKFWQQPDLDADDQFFGICRRFPPRTMAQDNDWCGEWVYSQEGQERLEAAEPQTFGD